MSTRFGPTDHTRLWEHLNALDDDIIELQTTPPAPAAVRAKIVKSSTLAFSANQWTLVNGFASTAYAAGITADLTNGRLTVGEAGRYNLTAHHNWLNYGSNFDRTGALVLGTSAPESDGSNVLDMYQVRSDSWLAATLAALDVDLAAGAVITSWIRSGTSGNFNGSSSTYSLGTFMSARKL